MSFHTEFIYDFSLKTKWSSFGISLLQLHSVWLSNTWIWLHGTIRPAARLRTFTERLWPVFDIRLQNISIAGTSMYSGGSTYKWTSASIDRQHAMFPSTVSSAPGPTTLKQAKAKQDDMVHRSKLIFFGTRFIQILEVLCRPTDAKRKTPRPVTGLTPTELSNTRWSSAWNNISLLPGLRGWWFNQHALRTHLYIINSQRTLGDWKSYYSRGILPRYTILGFTI